MAYDLLDDGNRAEVWKFRYTGAKNALFEASSFIRFYHLKNNESWVITDWYTEQAGSSQSPFDRFIVVLEKKDDD